MQHTEWSERQELLNNAIKAAILEPRMRPDEVKLGCASCCFIARICKTLPSRSSGLTTSLACQFKLRKHPFIVVLNRKQSETSLGLWTSLLSSPLHQHWHHTVFKLHFSSVSLPVKQVPSEITFNSLCKGLNKAIAWMDDAGCLSLRSTCGRLGGMGTNRRHVS